MAISLGRTIYEFTVVSLWIAQNPKRALRKKTLLEKTGIMMCNLCATVFSTKHGVYCANCHGKKSSFQRYLHIARVYLNYIPWIVCTWAQGVILARIRKAWRQIQKHNWQEQARSFLGLHGPYYELENIDFLSRSALVSTLSIHVRRARFYDGPALYRAILLCENSANWAERDAFKECLPQMLKFKHGFEFLAWLLEWNISQSDLALLKKATSDVALQLPKVTSYDEACLIFRALDNMPYLHSDFPKTFHMLVSEGSLSHSPKSHALINHYVAYPAYFQFFKALDRRWWMISEQVDGHPTERQFRYCFEPPSARTTVGRSAERAAEFPPHNPDTSLSKRSNFSLVFLQPSYTSSFVFWHLTSTLSFVTPRLVAQLGLTPRFTGYEYVLQSSGGAIHLVEQVVTLEFKIPGLAQDFSHEFVVYDVGYVPITLGHGFWVKYDISIRGATIYDTNQIEIPYVCPRVLAKRSESDSFLNFREGTMIMPSVFVQSVQRIS